MYKKWNNPTRTRTYYCWRNMKRRCYDKKDSSFRFYGALGITVCDRWINDFDAFFEDMGEAPTGLSLDRINYKGNYNVDNCRWATKLEQANNKENNKIINFNGESLSVYQWARKLNIKPSTLHKRIFNYTMPLEKALQENRVNKWKHGTRTGYDKHKCRCSLCKEAHNKRFRDMRRR